MRLPDPTSGFPDKTRSAIAWFWIVYWLRFFLFLPFMLARQTWISVGDGIGGWWTGNRSYRFLGGDLVVTYLSSWQVLPTTAIFGERFTSIRYRGALIDPGPAFARETVLAEAADAKPTPMALAVTHYHEEHIGNVAFLAQRLGIPIHGSRLTLAAIAQPETLSVGRRMLMGQPEPCADFPGHELGETLTVGGATLRVIDASGHCAGHVALFDLERGLLIAGDSFLHQIFTAPNGDATTADWIATLRRFAELDVRIMIGAHGYVYSREPALPRRLFVTKRRDPNQLIRDKLAFLEWATALVAEGERRGLPYSVIEACLFPWQQPWSWSTWFHDESFRLLSRGEFSRTHFVRSLSTRPESVPPRFRALDAFGERMSRHWPTLLRIHLLAAQPFNAVVIAGSIIASLAMILAAGWWAGVVDPAAPASVLAALPALWRGQAFLPIAAAVCGLTAWWAVIGGAITRRMAFDLLARPREPFVVSLRWCCRWSLVAPSLLASSCFVLMLSAPLQPWLLAPVLPIWLYAGFLYGATSIEPLSLREAFAMTHHKLAGWRRLLKLQAIYLVGFAVSTGTAYLLAGAWLALDWALLSGFPAIAWAIAAPALLYAVGYTTANLKSLQLYLYALAVDEP